jgi:hypothetical protein
MDLNLMMRVSAEVIHVLDYYQWQIAEEILMDLNFLLL